MTLRVNRRRSKVEAVPFQTYLTIVVSSACILFTLYNQSLLLNQYHSYIDDVQLQGFVKHSFLPKKLSDRRLSARMHDDDVNNQIAQTQNTTTPLPPKVFLPPHRKWAYAFLVGGCSYRKLEYRGFIYNVAVAAKRLRELGSQADIVVFIQMSYKKNDIELPQDETKLLNSVGVRIIYLPKFSSKVHEKFYALVMEKFRILQLSEYSRVLFLDSDIMPLCSMDYLFELSEPLYGEPALKENVVMSWRLEPANAGLFMLKPNQDDFNMLQDVLRQHQQKALSLPWPHWDPVEGWGHRIESWDAWKTPDGVTGTNWTWHASFADQGLLYYWTKYVKRSVSLIIKGEVENWGSSQNGRVALEKTHKKGMLNNYTCRQPIKGGGQNGFAPYRDFKHFTGRGKPWQLNETSILRHMALEDKPTTPEEEWYQTLKVVSQEAGVKLNFSFAINSGSENPPVGRFSDFYTRMHHIKAKAKSNWSAYA